MIPAPSGRATPVWFDSLAYCREKLLGGGAVPWTAPGELGSFFGKAQGMFGSDAVVVDVSDLSAERVSGDPALAEAMARRSRVAFALRTLLADDRLRATATDALAAIAGAGGGAPVALSIPSPARWMATAAEQPDAPAGDGGPPDPDHVDTASMYVADFLRAFAGAPVDALVLDEAATEAGALAGADAYRPVLNVAAHYEWPVWVRSDRAPAWPGGAVEGVTGWLGSEPPARPAGSWGLVAEGWLEAGPLPEVEGGAVVAVVPAEADPDAVMARVREIG